MERVVGSGMRCTAVCENRKRRYGYVLECCVGAKMYRCAWEQKGKVRLCVRVLCGNRKGIWLCVRVLCENREKMQGCVWENYASTELRCVAMCRNIVKIAVWERIVWEHKRCTSMCWRVVWKRRENIRLYVEMLCGNREGSQLCVISCVATQRICTLCVEAFCGIRKCKAVHLINDKIHRFDLRLRWSTQMSNYDRVCILAWHITIMIISGQWIGRLTFSDKSEKYVVYTWKITAVSICTRYKGDFPDKSSKQV